MSILLSSVPHMLLAKIIAIQIENNTINNCAVENHINMMQFEKEFDTVIMDKNTLLKTLSEHGIEGIVEKNNDVSCNYEGLMLDFYKMGEDTPYKVKITCNNEENIDILMNEINQEYALNAQEISYNKIKERLEDRNMAIENEEIYEDNTIVLTVNLE